MYDTLVSAFVKTVLEKLSSAAFKEINLVWGLKDELKRLESTLLTVQAVLHDAEAKQRNSQAINLWLIELKDVVYDAENILDRVVTQGLYRQMDLERGKYFKYAFHLIVNKLPRSISMAHKVKCVKKKIDVIASKKSKFHLSEVISSNRVSEIRETSSLVNELEVYGRNEEKNLIVEKILHVKHDLDDLTVHAICGMGGIGKTTLSQLVYNDDIVKNHFELRIWVCVSDDFSVKRLTQAIIRSIDGRCEENDLDPLQCKLQQRLRGKRYLLILDDVWNEDANEWDRLKEALRCGSNGSVVIVTTRIEKVAIMMGSITAYHLKYLSEGDSWSLFRKRAFANRQEDEILVEIGKQIVKKCGGVPLALKALGSLMRFKSTENEWEVIQNSDIWQLDEDEKGILPALRLSYDNLPYYMKQCFAYCCIFPKDYEMDKKELIQLWMANGFIPSQVHKNLAQTGREIFQELVWRSFFQDVREVVKEIYMENWGCTVCKMHDLGQSVMRHETFISDLGELPENLKMLRHLAFWDIWDLKKNFGLAVDVSLRSLIMGRREKISSEKYIFSFLSNQKYLRVLKLSGLFSDSVRKLQHLRYLVLFCKYITSLPESVTHLHNLQSLKLEESGKLCELPEDLKYLKHLYFLDMDCIRSLVSTPPDVGVLKYLRTLPTFIVGDDPSHQIHQLKDLDLEGKLSIQRIYYVRNFEDAESANLIAKKNLSYLGLNWISYGAHNDLVYPMMEGLFDEVLEGLQPIQNLKEIEICNFPGSWFPNWLSPSHSKNLKRITLFRCEKSEHLPPVGEFPYLTDVKLTEMKSIKRLDVEWHGDGEASFRALEQLKIRYMDALEEWIVPEGHAHFSSLKELGIYSCNQLLSIPTALFEMVSSTLLKLVISKCPKLESLPESMKHLRALQRLLISRCPQLEERCMKPNGEGWPKISHIPQIYINDKTIQSLRGDLICITRDYSKKQ